MDEKIKKTFFIIFLPIIALALPLFIMPLEKIIPFPSAIEEIIKAFFIIPIILLIPAKKYQIALTVFFAFIFSCSENIFYLSNFIETGSFNIFFKRFFLTTLLHVLTSIIILIPAQKKLRFILLSVPTAMLVHYFYNQLAKNF